MKSIQLLAVLAVCPGFFCAPANGQPAIAAPSPESTQPAPNPEAGNSVAVPSPVPLEWTPPALQQLSAQAAVKSSFTLDRNLLSAAAAIVPDSEAADRQVIRKLDGVSVHTMRFGDSGIPDEGEIDSIRAAYHLRGWKHLVSTTKSGGPVHNETTDVWVVMDGVDVRGAVILAETPKSLTLVTVAGNLNPVDLLHLRGHFGIPRFDGDQLNGTRDK
jgi:Domain of unknown function (DUF4252)